MTEVNSLHRRAMKLANDAVAARLRGDTQAEASLLNEAFEAERDAALLMVSQFGVEPTRSVLFRSAAALALDAERFDEAERMANLGLGGEPPEPIRSELHDIVEEISIQRHLSLRGIELLGNEFQMALWSGNAVGSGIVSSKEMIDRVRRIEQMTTREVARRRGLPFDENVSLPKHLRDDFQTSISVPRAGSFAFTVRVGIGPQLDLFTGDSNVDLVADITTYIAVINDGDTARLESLVPEESYRRNYISQVRHLAPDGTKVKEVGITATRSGETYSVQLAERPALMSIPDRPAAHEENEVGQTVQLVGELRTASGHRGSKVGILPRDAKKLQRLSVPKGMLNDIVRPFFGEEVVVEARKTKKGLELVDLWLFEE